MGARTSLHRSLLLAAFSVACHREGGSAAPPPVESSAPVVAPTASAVSTPPAPVATAPERTLPPLPGKGAWLRVDGNRIFLPSGQPFHGRGANVQDTRSCNACAFEEPHVDEVLRRIDTLTDVWHANFVRLTLESYAKPERRQHWKSALDDERYFADIRRIVAHVGKKPGVYLLLSVWHDPSLSKEGWPTARTKKLWQKLAKAFADDGHVLFGLVNEPESNADGKLDAKVHAAMSDVVAAIRATEPASKHHVVLVQGTREWARRVDYYVSHPISAGGGANIAYEVHVYDPVARFGVLFEDAAAKLPIVIGEFGPVSDVATMTLDDCRTLMDRAEALGIPYLAYTFHFRCPPNLLADTSGGTCGVGAPLLPSSDWGELLKTRLARPW